MGDFLKEIIDKGAQTPDPKAILAGDALAEISCGHGITMQVYGYNASQSIKGHIPDVHAKHPNSRVIKIDDDIVIRYHHIFLKFDDIDVGRKYIKNGIARRATDIQPDGSILVGEFAGDYGDERTRIGATYLTQSLNEMRERLKKCDLQLDRKTVNQLTKVLADDCKHARENWMPFGMDLSR